MNDENSGIETLPKKTAKKAKRTVAHAEASAPTQPGHTTYVGALSRLRGAVADLARMGYEVRGIEQGHVLITRPPEKIKL
jgi:hypothetical protein